VTRRRLLLPGGSEGNKRLTGATAAVLLFLLAAEGVTIPFIAPLLPVHVFLGLMLVPPLLVKLAATGYRFLRYYSGHPSYRSEGPPRTGLRLLAPVVVVSSTVLFASGLGLLFRGPPGGALLGLHKASFVVWLFSTGAHVLAHLRSLPRLVAADWTSDRALPGSRQRRLLVAATLIAGLALALALLPSEGTWLHWLDGEER